MTPARLEGDWTSWKNRPHATGDDKKRKQAEAFEALNTFVRKHNGWVTSPPGKTLRIEVMKDSSAKLADELTVLGYHVARCGSVSRTTGADYVSPKTERLTRTTPNAFTECDVLEIRLDGR
jgi:hypothetical protein